MSNLEDLLSQFKNSSSEDDEDAPSGFSADKPYSPPPGMPMPTIKTTVGPPPNNDEATTTDAIEAEDKASRPTFLGTSPRPVQDYMAKLNAAQAEAAGNRERTGITAGLAQLVHGISGAAGQADVSGILSQGKANDNAPVQAIMDQKSAMQMQKESDAEDPNSEASINFRKSLKLIAPKIADAYGESFDKIAASDGANITNVIKTKAQLDQRAEAAQLRADLIKSRSDDAAESKSNAAKDKNDKEHDKYLTHIEDKEMGWRSDPASTRFDQNLAAVSTGDAILQKYRGREDEMPVQDIHALVSDKLKAMTGAAPTEQEIAAQMPKTLGTKWASTKSFFTGNPEPANAGGFVKSIDNYFKDMEAKSLAGVRNRQKTVAGDPRLTPEERERLVQIGVPQPVYKENARAGLDPMPAAPHQGKYPPGSMISVKGKNYTVGSDGDTLTEAP